MDYQIGTRGNMTDSELLDGLQAIIDQKASTLGSCRSGTKIMVSDKDTLFPDDPEARRYYGGGNIRKTIELALSGEDGVTPADRLSEILEVREKISDVKDVLNSAERLGGEVDDPTLGSTA